MSTLNTQTEHLEQPTEASKGVRGAANRGRGAGSSNHRVGGNTSLQQSQRWRQYQKQSQRWRQHQMNRNHRGGGNSGNNHKDWDSR